MAFRCRVLKEVKKSPHGVSTGGHGAGADEVPSRCSGGVMEVPPSGKSILRPRDGVIEMPHER